MDLLTDNALVEMPGPDFLRFYALVALIVLVAFNAIVRLEDANGRSPPPVPTRPDPYEIAYLRGGVGAVIGLAIYALKSSQMIELARGGELRRVAGLAAPTNPVEARIFEDVVSGVSVKQLLGSRELRASILYKCEDFRQRLARQDLVMTDAARRRAIILASLAALALGGLATLKIVVAQMHGHRNVQFLFVEAAVALALLLWSSVAVTRSVANQRGRAYLKLVKTAYAGGTRSASSSGSCDSAATGATLAAVAALGFAALHGTSDEAFAREFARSTGSNGGSGCSSGGSCGGGGGGGCGGCGGGGD